MVGCECGGVFGVYKLFYLHHVCCFFFSTNIDTFLTAIQNILETVQKINKRVVLIVNDLFINL